MGWNGMEGGGGRCSEKFLDFHVMMIVLCFESQSRNGHVNCGGMKELEVMKRSYLLLVISGI